MADRVPSLPDISDVNRMGTPEELLSVTKVLFESTLALTSRLLRLTPFQSYQELIQAAQRLLDAPSSDTGMTEADIVEILNAHPRLGAPKQTLSALSLREQNANTPSPSSGSGHTAGAGAGAAVDEATLAELAVLNDKYEAKYGFKFVTFVNGRSRAAVLPEFRERLENSTRSAEIKTGLKAMVDIARDRLSKLQILPPAESDAARKSKM